MTNLTLRSLKSSALTSAEIDANFIALNTNKVETSEISALQASILNSQLQAQAVIDNALIHSSLYATEALGRAAVADNATFSVQGSGDIAALEYRRTNSTTSVLIASYPSAAAVSDLRLTDEFGTAHQRYLDGLRTAGITKPKAAVVILLGQSLNAPRLTIVQSKAAPIAKMPIGGTSIASWQYNATNALWCGHWSELDSVVDYEERTGQTPGTGIINALAGRKFPRIYVGNAAIGGRTLETLKSGLPVTNLWALLKRLCEHSRVAGYDPQVMFYTAHGEANAGTATSEDAYYALGQEYYGMCQMYAAQAMRKPGYLAPIVFTYPVQQGGGASGENDRAIKRAILRLTCDLPNGINMGGIYQWPVSTDRVHPTEQAYVLRGEAVGRTLKRFFDNGAKWASLHITDVTISGTTFVATFSDPVQRDVTLGAGEALNSALAEDGFEWIDNGVSIAISGLLYQGWKVTGALASTPVGTLAQQTLRIAVQTTSGFATGVGNIPGSLVRSTDTGWPAISDYTYTNYSYASPQTFTSVRTA